MTTEIVSADMPKTGGGAISPRTRAMIEDSILPTLLRLAAPNLIWVVAQATVTIGETYFVGWLGAEALAGVSLVFPLLMLMQTMGGGGLGGGVASAIARALGARRRDDANALVLNALAIGLGFGFAFTAVVTASGPALFAAMGAAGAALHLAELYAAIIFAGAVLFWLFNTLGAILRGSGIMSLPAMVSILGAVMTLTVSPVLILGIGPLPGLGVAGAAVATLAYYGIGVIVLGGYLLSGRAPVRPVLRARLEWRLCREILRVGLPGMLNTLIFNLGILVFTALVGPFGTKAIAGYGIGARLEYMQVPIVFGLGTALTTMVGTNVGAGLDLRAKRVAWIGAALAASISGAIGLVAALAPHLWLDIFSSDAEVFAAGERYLQIVGPAYALYGVGLALYFAAQGAGHLFWLLVISGGRLAISAGVGWLAAYRAEGGFEAVYAAMTVGQILFGGGSALATWRSRWRA
jgi:putative MATE family efflux protein